MRFGMLFFVTFLSASSATAQNIASHSSCWIQAAFAGQHQTICDPFDRQDTECVHSRGPAASLEIGNDWSRLGATGGFLNGSVNGHRAFLSLRGSPLSIGPVRVGVMIEIGEQAWERPVFISGNTILGVHRLIRSGFIGLEVGAGDYHRAHVRTLFLPGYYASTYQGTLVVPGFAGHEPLALDEFVLERIRVEADKIPLGNRVLLSGSIQRTRMHPIKYRHTISPVVHSPEWSGMIGASVYLSSPRQRLGLLAGTNMTFARAQSSLIDEHSQHLYLAIRFR